MKQWILIPVVGLIVEMVAGCGGPPPASANSSLDPGEKVAAEFIKYKYITGASQNLGQLVEPNDEDVSTNPLPGSITPGTAWFASVPDGQNGESVYIYLSPSMTSGGLLWQIDEVKQNGKWLVSKEQNINIPRRTFSDFQKSPDYQSMSISDWKEAKLQ